MKIAILLNDHLWAYNLRRELVEQLLSLGHEVTLVLPYGEKVEHFKMLGCGYRDISFEKHGMNPIKEYSLYRRYIKILGELLPDLVLTFSTKPNIYGGLASAALKIPYMPSVTGIGTAMQAGAKKMLLKSLYRAAFRGAGTVFFQNSENMRLFFESKIFCGKRVLVPGSGVNTEYHCTQDYPCGDTVKFLFIGRLHTDKGIENYLEAAHIIKGEFPKTEFHVVGMSEGQRYTDMVESAQSAGDVIYHGALSDVRGIIGQCHCTVLPSYHEGMANVLLESASAARPLIATDISGCREIVDDGKNGYLCSVNDTEDLCEKIRRFLSLSHEEKKEMGLCGREKVMREFGRKTVVEKYINAIENR